MMLRLTYGHHIGQMLKKLIMPVMISSILVGDGYILFLELMLVIQIVWILLHYMISSMLIISHQVEMPDKVLQSCQLLILKLKVVNSVYGMIWLHMVEDLHGLIFTIVLLMQLWLLVKKLGMEKRRMVKLLLSLLNGLIN